MGSASTCAPLRRYENAALGSGMNAALGSGMDAARGSRTDAALDSSMNATLGSDMGNLGVDRAGAHGVSVTVEQEPACGENEPILPRTDVVQGRLVSGHHARARQT